MFFSMTKFERGKIQPRSRLAGHQRGTYATVRHHCVDGDVHNLGEDEGSTRTCMRPQARAVQGTRHPKATARRGSLKGNVRTGPTQEVGSVSCREVGRQ